jgi:hypothetical protein
MHELAMPKDAVDAVTDQQVRGWSVALSPPGAAAAGVGEEPDLAVQCLLRPDGAAATVRVVLRFRQLQWRLAQRASPGGFFTPVAELRSGGTTWTSCEETVAVERDLGTVGLAALRRGVAHHLRIAGGERVEPVEGGRLVRRREPLQVDVVLSVEDDGPLLRLAITVANTARPAPDRDTARATSLIGAHLLLRAAAGRFVSVVDPPEEARAAAGRCRQRRCRPVLAGAGPVGQTSDVVLAAPVCLDGRSTATRQGAELHTPGTAGPGPPAGAGPGTGVPRAERPS